MTAQIAHIKSPWIRKPLWLMWFPVEYLSLWLDIGNSPRFNDLVWTCFDLGWEGIK